MTRPYRFSRRDSRGKLWVACSECERGGNGDRDSYLCSAGWTITNGGTSGCFCGTLLTRLRTCRVCGCTEADCSQCIARTGEACHWVEPDLCSACVGAKP